MCGRYVLHTSADALAEALGAVGPLPNFPARYNLAPTQDGLILRRGEDGTLRFSVARWGLVPAWAKDPAIGSKMINARAETLAEKPSFRTAFRQRRCVVPADGFYEWASEGKAKKPYWIRRADGRIMALAGLWERAKAPDGGTLETYTIVTTESRGAARRLHDRCPVILEPEDVATWLAPADGTALGPLLAPREHDLAISPADPRANSPRNDDAALIEAPQGSLL
jgi:putative SOS response-associated peptidase YedK